MKLWRGVLIGLVIGGIVMLTILKSGVVEGVMNHRAVAVVRIDKQESMLVSTGGAPPAFRPYLGGAGTISEMVMKDKILDMASKKTGLNRAELRRVLSTEVEEGSSLISIVSSHPDKESAVLIANAVAEVYVGYLNENENQRAAQALKTLDEELQEYGEIVQDYRKKFTILIQQYGIPGLGRATEEDLYRRAQDKLDRLWQDKQFLGVAYQKLSQAKLSTRKKMSEEIIDFGNQSQKNFDQIRGLNEQIDALFERGLGADHPEVLRTQEAATKVFEVAKKEAMAILETLDEGSEKIEKEISEMMVMRRRGGNSPPDHSMIQHQYDIAKAEYEDSRKLYLEMALKQNDLRHRLKLGTPVASLHQRAE